LIEHLQDVNEKRGTNGEGAKQIFENIGGKNRDILNKNIVMYIQNFKKNRKTYLMGDVLMLSW